MTHATLTWALVFVTLMASAMLGASLRHYADTLTTPSLDLETTP